MAGERGIRITRRGLGTLTLSAASATALAIVGRAPGLALAAAYDPSLEGAAIQCYDGTFWWLASGYRHGVPDDTTLYAIYSGNGKNAYAWSESAVYSIPEGTPLPSRIPASSRAADWALKQVGSLNWGSGDDTWCLMFAANAFGEAAAGYDTAYDCWAAFGRPGPVPVANELPRGEIVFFDKNAGNGYAGHTGLFIGNGQYVSVTPAGVQVRAVVYSSTNFARYVGHAAAPLSWPGL